MTLSGCSLNVFVFGLGIHWDHLGTHCIVTQIVTLINRSWHHDKDVDILTYRDRSFPSKYTGKWRQIHYPLVILLTVLCQEPPHRST